MARYKDAIEWLARNDDNQWTESDPETPSVSACLVADLFLKSESQVREDICKTLAKLYPEK